MIKNEKQYLITKRQAERFVQGLADLAAKNLEDDLLRQIQEDSLRSQLEDLNESIREYEELKSGEWTMITVDSFDQLPEVLIKARISQGLTQKDLAKRLGMKEQQVQRYERTDYQSASLSKLKNIVESLGIKVRKEIFLPTSIVKPKALFARLKASGLEKEFLLKRILPPKLAESFSERPREADEIGIRNAVESIGRVYDWESNYLLGNEPLVLNSEPVGMARFKLPALANQRKVNAYTVYAHYLALLVLQATPNLRTGKIPTEPKECREAIISRYGEVSLENVLKFAWALGIAIVPLCDSGGFHGACWRVEGRNVIVLKQKTRSFDRWINDCLHEIYHAGQEPEESSRTVIEEDLMSTSRRNSEEEQEATLFAGEVTLDCRAEELAQLCVEKAGGSVERLKGVVPRVAKKESVEVGALANYMAFRLSLQDINWWGAATNLQASKGDPFEVARDALIDNLDFTLLNIVDKQILLQAFTKEGK